MKETWGLWWAGIGCAFNLGLLVSSDSVVYSQWVVSETPFLSNCRKAENANKTKNYIYHSIYFGKVNYPHKSCIHTLAECYTATTIITIITLGQVRPDPPFADSAPSPILFRNSEHLEDLTKYSVIGEKKWPILQTKATGRV